MSPEEKIFLQRIKCVARWLRFKTVGETAAHFVALLCAALLMMMLADNFLALPGWLRIALAAALLLWCLYYGLFQTLPALRGKIDPVTAAVRIEEASGAEYNPVVNALFFMRTEIPPNVNEKFVRVAVRDGIEFSRTAAWFKNLGWRRLKRRLVHAVLAAGLFGGYVFAFPAYSRNALLRYAYPSEWIPPARGIQLTVTPGNVTVPYGSDVEFRVAVRGGAPDEVAFEIVGVNTPRTAMRFDGNVFRHVERSVTRSFTYQVFAADGFSPRYRIAVAKPPRVIDFVLTVTYPAYLDYEDEVLKSPPVALKAPVGTTVVIDLTLSGKPERVYAADDGGQLPFERAGGGWRMERKFENAENGAMKIISTIDGGEYSLVSFDTRIPDDAPPTAALSDASPIRRIPADAETLLALKANDDFGVRRIELQARKGDGLWIPLKQFEFGPGHRTVGEIGRLAPADDGYKIGDTIEVRLLAHDNAPHAGRPVFSDIATFEIVSGDDLLAARNHRLDGLFDRLRKLAKMQAVAREKVRLIYGERGMYDLVGYDMAARMGEVKDAQTVIRSGATGVLTDARHDAAFGDLCAGLDTLVRGALTDVIADVEELRVGGAVKNRVRKIGELHELQGVIEKRLLELIANVRIDAAASAADSVPDAEKSEDTSRKVREKLEALRADCQKFVEEQKKIIAMTKEFANKPVDDLTNEDRKKLEELALHQLQWSKIFQEALMDLSKLPPQDFSNSDLLKELNESYSEIQKAAEALQHKNVEIAVPHEQAGLELATEIETNLERWLPDEPDYKKWIMEEPAGDYDVPLADLPGEIEDIIGELLETEEDLSDEVDDITSGWMDSLDKGAGWDAADGPISNMSAKGVTGNQMPNSSEIGGRSGEGRTGKSQGQFVEETATGKGGRKTPSRLTPDAFEAGEVKDTSRDPIGGATGGGKASGQAQEGLRGPVPPPEVGDRLKRLGEAQAELRQKSERLLHTLRRRGLPTSELEVSVNQMKYVEERLKQGEPLKIPLKNSSLIKNLRDARQSVNFAGRIIDREKADLPPALRKELTAAQTASPPRAYRQILNEYYKALARGDDTEAAGR